MKRDREPVNPLFSEPPRHRAILAVDIERSTARTNTSKAFLRKVMYDLVEGALQAGGITEEHRDPLINCGDGVLVLVRPVDQIPKTLLLNPVIPVLSDLLADHNAHHPGQELRLRAVVHAGELHYDRQGCFGEALDIAFRLLNAPETKTALRETTEPLVLVTSDDIYQSILKHGYDGIDHHRFRPLRVWTADHEHHGWMQGAVRPNLVATELAG